jgi:lipopolysaccharide transport system permease protein
VSDKYKWLMAFNPMSAVIDSARSVILNASDPDLKMLFISAGISLLLFVLGVAYFRKTERYFADVI